jgi:hypothetical protein
MAALLPPNLKDFRVSFLTSPILLALVQKVQELLVFKMPPNEKFSSADVDISFIALL